MPERTNAEWRALADRIAREVMGCTKWDDLLENAQWIHWSMIEEDPDEWNLTFNREKWWFLDESGCPDYEYSIEEWQPHNNVVQALTILDRIAETYHYGHSIFLLASHLTRYRVLIWKGFGCVGMWQGEHTNRAKAICLVIEEFMEDSC